MAEWLILRLPRSADAPATWLPIGAAGQALSLPRSGTLSEAAADAVGRRIAVLANASDVLCLEIELPQRSGVRPAQVAPFAVEEQLIGDIDLQHFALGRRDSTSGRTPVAIVARQTVQEWLGALRAAGLEAEALYSEAALLPRHPGSTVALLEDDCLTVCRPEPGSPPISLPAAEVAGALELAHGGATLDTVDLMLYVAPRDWPHRSAEIESLRGRLAGLRPQVLTAGVLPWLAALVPNTAAVNLLQGAFEARHTTTFDWRRWRLAGILLVGLIALHGAGKAWALAQVRAATTATETELAQLGRELLPDEPSSTSTVRSRIQARLAAAATSGPGGLLESLQALATALRANGGPGTALRSLNWHNGVAEIVIRTSDAQRLEAINQALRSAGWRSEVLSGATAGASYEGRLELRSATEPR